MDLTTTTEEQAKVKKQIDSLIESLKNSERTQISTTYTPKPCLSFLNYMNVCGYLDGKYFSLYVLHWRENNRIRFEITGCVTEGKRSLKAFLKTVTELKFKTVQ